jgi:DNA-binding GntR family transcriptional regulator
MYGSGHPACIPESLCAQQMTVIRVQMENPPHLIHTVRTAIEEFSACTRRVLHAQLLSMAAQLYNVNHSSTHRKLAAVKAPHEVARMLAHDVQVPTHV